MAHPDVPLEQAHVDHAYERLETMRSVAQDRLQDAFEERGGTFQSVTERDIRVRTNLNRLEQLQIGGESLIFGRIDRDGEPGVESFHLGRLAISDEDQEPLVVDWRAPVAEPFYRATGAHPMGLTLRRHFLTDGPRVLDLEDEVFSGLNPDGGLGLGLSGSQVLMATLERSRTGRMRDIVATVQREQDEIIRGQLGGVLVVQGGPGTGKTAVALHRAAYLLYTHRFPLESQGVLLVGPTRLFLRYIEHVLPSLGESGVELSTAAGLFGLVSPTGVEPAALARLKGDARMARFLARAVADRQRPLRHRVEIPYGRSVLRLSRGASEQIVSAAKRRPGPHNSRRRLVEALLWRHLLEQLERRGGAPDLAPGADHPGGPGEARGMSAAELGQELRHVPEVAEALERMWPLLTPQQFLHDLFGAPPLIDLAGRPNLSDQERASLFRPRRSVLEDVAWTEADMALLDEARALLGPLRRRASSDGQDEIRSYGHIVVDEAQDLSPMELRMLARRSLSGSMTVVGDLGQGTGTWAPDSWDEILSHLPGRRGHRLVELTVNYRTPAEIMALAERVLAATTTKLTAPEAVRSTGEQPRVVAVGNHSSDRAGDLQPGESVVRDLDGGFQAAAEPDLFPGVSALTATAARLAEEELEVVSTGSEGTVAVLAPPSLLDELAAALSARGLSFGLAGKDALDMPISLLELEEAKGLEFDAVVVVEPALLAAEAARGLRAVYVAMTRSTRRLAIVHDRPLPVPLQPPATEG